MLKQLIAALLLLSFSATTAQAAAGIGPYDVPALLPLESRSALALSIWRLPKGMPEASYQLTPDGPGPAQGYSLADGLLAGQQAAEAVATRFNFKMGLASGILLGLIGTGGCYFATGPASLGDQEHRVLIAKRADYRLGFENGFKEKSKARKRRAALGGGLIGTLVAVAVLLGAQ